MKKTILSLLLIVLVSLPVFAQPKVNISVINLGLYPGNIIKADVMATVLTGQSWKVGSSNIQDRLVNYPR